MDSASRRRPSSMSTRAVAKIAAGGVQIVPVGRGQLAGQEPRHARLTGQAKDRVTTSEPAATTTANARGTLRDTGGNGRTGTG